MFDWLFSCCLCFFSSFLGFFYFWIRITIRLPICILFVLFIELYSVIHIILHSILEQFLFDLFCRHWIHLSKFPLFCFWVIFYYRMASDTWKALRVIISFTCINRFNWIYLIAAPTKYSLVNPTKASPASSFVWHWFFKKEISVVFVFRSIFVVLVPDHFFFFFFCLMFF